MAQEPQGVEFYSVRTGETHYAKSEAQLQAYINSSDMGVNASRGQDFGWRLGKDWVKAIRKYRLDEAKMALLSQKLGGDMQPGTLDIAYAIYGDQLRAYNSTKVEEENPFEEQYLQSISKTTVVPEVETVPEVVPEPTKIGVKDTTPEVAPVKVKTSKNNKNTKR